jgi:hypothetical protein
VAKTILRGNKFVDLTGYRFGRLTVLECVGHYENDSHHRWKCRCECGKISIVAVNHLRCGRTRSCGCLQKQLAGQRARTHGMTKSLEYRSWLAMRKRCSDPKHPLYHRYGGRGILIDFRWLGKNGFKHFLDDMGPSPSARHTLDRIDNDGHYEPSNCRWVTRKEQCRNTSRNHRYAFRGLDLTIPEWAERIGMKVSTLNSRLTLYSWSIKKALTAPIRTSLASLPVAGNRAGS